MSADELTVAVRRLVRQVSHWTPSRWAASSASVVRRGDAVHGLVQWLADQAADAEREPRRQVPRLDNDLALPDQLRVVAADLVSAGTDDETIRAAASRVNQTRRAL
jgi:hypothetical protein